MGAWGTANDRAGARPEPATDDSGGDRGGDRAPAPRDAGGSNFLTNGRRAGHVTGGTSRSFVENGYVGPAGLLQLTVTGGTERLKLSEAASASVVFTFLVKVYRAAAPV